MAWRGNCHAHSCGFCCTRGGRGVAVAEAVDARGMAFGGEGGGHFVFSAN